MKLKNVNTKKSAKKYTRQNSDLYNAFSKYSGNKTKPNKRTSVTISGVKVGKSARGKLSHSKVQYYFNKLSSKKWKYDSKTNTFKTIGRSPFYKKTLIKRQREIELATRQFQRLLKDQLVSTNGLEDPTQYQIDVLADIYNVGMDIEEFKSKYPDDYARLFENQPDEL